MASEHELQQAILDVQGRRMDWHRTMDGLLADAQAFSAKARGRGLPAPNGLGQLPPGGVRIDERVGGQEAGDVRTTVIAGEDVAWQNLANKLQDTRARGDDELDHLEGDLNGQLGALRAGEQQGGPGGAPPAPTSDPRSVLPWVDYLTAIIAYAAVFYGMMAASQTFGLFTIFVGVGMLALTGILQGFIIRPLQLVARMIVGGIVQILVDLVEFVGEWLNAVVQYFQGDLLKAILRIVLLAFAMWVWTEAMKVPAIKGVIDYAGNLVAQVTKWVNDQVDSVLGMIEDLRGQVRDSVKVTMDAMGDFGQQLQGDILGVVDRLFTGLGRQVSAVRYEVLQEVDLTRAALGLKVDVLGQRVALLPDEVRKYLVAFGRAKPAATLANTMGLVASVSSGVLGLPDFTVTPWDVLGEVQDDLAQARLGTQHDAQGAILEVREDLQALHAGQAPPARDPNPPMPDWWPKQDEPGQDIPVFPSGA